MAISVHSLTLYELTLLMVFTCKDSEEWNATTFLTKLSLTILSNTVCKFETGHPCRLPPLLCGHVLIPWLSSSSGSVVTVDTSFSVKWGYKATLQLAARVPLWLGGSTLHQGRRHWSIEKPDTEGYLPISPPLDLANHDSVLWAIVLVIRSTIGWHLQAATSFPQPNTWSGRRSYLIHITWNLHPSSVVLQWMSTVEVITSH